MIREFVFVRRRLLITAIAVGLTPGFLFCVPDAHALYKTGDADKASQLALRAFLDSRYNVRNVCYSYVLRAMVGVGLLPRDYWKKIPTDSAYKFAFGKPRKGFPARYPLKRVSSYAPWKEGTIVVWNRDPDNRHSCGRETELGKRYGHIEIVVDPAKVGRPQRAGKYLACFGMCGYTSFERVNAYLRKGCVRVYEPARRSS